MKLLENRLCRSRFKVQIRVKRWIKKPLVLQQARRFLDSLMPSYAIKKKRKQKLKEAQKKDNLPRD